MLVVKIGVPVRFLALATDYDGTLATHGRVDGIVLPALDRLRASGRKLLLVTGRELHDLLNVFPEAALFDRVIAENGALLYRPSSKEEVALCGPPDPGLLAALRGLGVPFSTGRALIATDDAHHAAVASAIHGLKLALEVHISLNKGSLMILPTGVDKKRGLEAALAELQLAPANVVAVGDAENDASMLAACGCAAAVANALPHIKRNADLVTASTHGAGVAELIEQILDNDLARYALRHTRG
jgi:hydroxymethylpyrimidine pyrophosphatase-like HAD family hydrolase